MGTPFSRTVPKIPKLAKEESYGASLQSRTRSDRRFSDVEHSLPQCSQHSSSTADHAHTPNPPEATLTKTLLSYLGPYNPSPTPLDSDDVVWLLDNTAYQPSHPQPSRRGRRGKGNNHEWEAEFVACVFNEHQTWNISDAVQSVADRLGYDSQRDQDVLKTIGRRLVPFIRVIQPGKVVLADFGGGEDGHKLKLGPGGRNGISSDVLGLPAHRNGDVVTSTARTVDGVTGKVSMKTKFVGREGWGVVSDVDDTIKITMTSDPIGILKSTFVDEPRAVEGMPELYRFLQGQVSEAAPWFYLSASPYNLYPFLHSFVTSSSNKGPLFPHGQLLLRDASWMSLPGLLSNLTVGTQEYKMDRMRKIHGWVPQRKMICVGDSTQTDPESYGVMCREAPGWIRCVLIRKVTDVAGVGVEDKNGEERFEKAFEGVPRDVWHVFEDPKECYDIIAKLFA